ncbi:MAG: hypothetical protein LAO76_14975 [Acidobacteriia bacterium]|nr:hypothetical protein [Terriglobia bacterium]
MTAQIQALQAVFVLIAAWLGWAGFAATYFAGLGAGFDFPDDAIVVDIDLGKLT